MATKNSLILGRMVGGLVILASLVVLLGLGTWQVQRMQWKNDLLAKIHAGLDGEIADDLPVASTAAGHEYARVRVRGVFDYSRQVLKNTTGPTGGAGYHVYTPLLRLGAQSVVINRGFVPAAMRGDGPWLHGATGAEVELSGVLRNSAIKTTFTPDNDPQAGQWFYADVPGFAAWMGLQDVYPSIVELDLASGSEGYPISGVTRVNIPNNHLGYAVTWYGLALSLVIVVAVYNRRRKTSA